MIHLDSQQLSRDQDRYLSDRKDYDTKRREGKGRKNIGRWGGYRRKANSSDKRKRGARPSQWWGRKEGGRGKKMSGRRGDKKISVWTGGEGGGGRSKKEQLIDFGVGSRGRKDYPSKMC